MYPRRKQGPRSLWAPVTRAAVCVLAIGLVVAGLLAGYFLCMVEGLIDTQWPGHAGGSQPKDADLPYLASGIRLPPARAADAAGLADYDEVIGVCVAGRARAYAVETMGGQPARHVVNDLLGGEPVSVTYCDRTNCSRVFTGGRAGEPLELGVGGFLHKGLALRVGDVNYSQATGERLGPEEGDARIPYAELDHERTTWKAWREAHPDTDVYVGDPPEAREATPN